MFAIERPSDLRPGDLMFGPIHGFVGGAVGIAQLMLAIAEPGLIWKQGPEEWFHFRHTGLVVEASGWGFELLDSGGVRGTGPKLVEAMPGGIREIEIGRTKWNREHLYIRPEYAEQRELGYSMQGHDVAVAARGYVGRPYDFATYGAIPAYRRGIRTAGIKRIISDTDTMMCSRTVDAALCEAGYHLFNDRRLPGNVTPSELLRKVIIMPMAGISKIVTP